MLISHNWCLIGVEDEDAELVMENWLKNGLLSEVSSLQILF